MRGGRTTRDDTGNALVEFVWLSIVLMVPLVYLVVAVLRVQATAFGASTAARAAARAYVAAPDGMAASDRVARARAAAALALADQGVRDLPPDAVVIGPPVVEPGRPDLVEVTVTVSVQADLPGVPAWLGHGGSVGVTSHHTERLDVYAGASP